MPLYFFSNADDAFCFSLPSPTSDPIYIASQDGLSEVLPFGHDRCTASPLPILNSLSTTLPSAQHLAERDWSILPVCLYLFFNYNILRWSQFSVGKCNLATTLTQLISLSTSSPNQYIGKEIQGWAFPASASSQLTRCHTSSSRGFSMRGNLCLRFVPLFRIPRSCLHEESATDFEVPAFPLEDGWESAVDV